MFDEHGEKVTRGYARPANGRAFLLTRLRALREEKLFSFLEDEETVLCRVDLNWPTVFYEIAFRYSFTWQVRGRGCRRNFEERLGQARELINFHSNVFEINVRMHQSKKNEWKFFCFKIVTKIVFSVFK